MVDPTQTPPPPPGGRGGSGANINNSGGDAKLFYILPLYISEEPEV